jgi:hypothetical protein
MTGGGHGCACMQATQEKVAALMQAADTKAGRGAARGRAAATSPGSGKPAASGWRVRSRIPAAPWLSLSPAWQQTGCSRCCGLLVSYLLHICLLACVISWQGL